MAELRAVQAHGAAIRREPSTSWRVAVAGDKEGLLSMVFKSLID